MPSPPTVNNLELSDGWSVDVSTIHNGRFTETCCFVLKDGRNPSGMSYIDIRSMSESHIETTKAVYEALRQMVLANDGGKLSLDIIVETLARFDGAWCDKCQSVDRYEGCQDVE